MFKFWLKPLKTPDLGINYDSISSAIRKEVALSEPHPSLTWYKTLIESDKNLIHQWSSNTLGCAAFIQQKLSTAQ